MLSKSLIKLIASLQIKKYRERNQLFVVEGEKGVNEFLDSNFELAYLFVSDASKLSKREVERTFVSELELKKISSLKNPSGVLAVFKMNQVVEIDYNCSTVVLDGINDPGNLGTIIRLCDWFGVSQIICSQDTVDCFNAKVVQSTMGSLTRVNIIYTDLSQYLSKVALPIYAAMMDGSSLYKEEFTSEFILVMGNEANGVTDGVMNQVQNHVTIPKFGLQQTESLNVATATGIILSEIRRGA